MSDAPTRIEFSINGARVASEAEPRMLLADFIRHRLGLTGTHVGCAHGACGACTVLVDGRPARSCLMFAIQAQGALRSGSQARVPPPSGPPGSRDPREVTRSECGSPA